MGISRLPSTHTNMAKIKKLKENGGTIYPATILDAVVDPSTNRKLSNTAIRYFTGGVSLYYKFMSFDIGGDKGMIRFGIVSPLLGYGEFMINWGWQGATEEKHCNPYCVFSTGSQMYNRVKLVRTGGSTFDAYFASNSGNDYATFVFMGQSGTSVKSFSASGVSSIPTVYRESAYVGNICFGTVTGTLAGTADNAATADRLNTASNVAGDEDMPDTDSVQSFAGYVGKDKTNKCPILSVTTEFLDGSQQLSLQIGYSTEHGLMCRIGGRETNGEFTFSDWQKILTQDI